MARKHYQLEEVLRQLSKKNDVLVNTETKTIYVLNGKSKKPQFQQKHDLGNGSWGKIDFLVKYCEYSQYFVSEF